MPLYEYECKQCKRHTERIQKFSDAEITECPHCGGALERVISAPAIAFKGGGWFADGYGNAKPSSGKSDAGKSISASSDSSSSVKSDSATPPSSAPDSASSSAPATSSASASDKK